MTVTPIASIIEADVAEQEYDLVAAAAGPTQTQLHQAIIAHRNEPNHREDSNAAEAPWLFGGVAQCSGQIGYRIFPLSATQTLIVYKDRNLGPGDSHYFFYAQIFTKDAALGITKMGAPFFVGYATSNYYAMRFVKLKDGKFLLTLPGGHFVGCYTYSIASGYISLLSTVNANAEFGVTPYPGYTPVRVDDNTALVFLANGSVTMACRQCVFNDDGTTSIANANPTGLPSPTIYGAGFTAVQVTATDYAMAYYTTTTNWRVHTFTYDKATDTITNGSSADETVVSLYYGISELFAVKDGSSFDLVGVIGYDSTTVYYNRYTSNTLTSGKTQYSKTVSSLHSEVSVHSDFGGNYIISNSVSGSGVTCYMIGVPATGQLTANQDWGGQNYRAIVPVGDWLYNIWMPNGVTTASNYVLRYTLGTDGAAITARNAPNDFPIFGGTNQNAAYFDPTIGDGGRYIIAAWGFIMAFKPDGVCDGVMYCDSGTAYGARCLCPSTTAGRVVFAYSLSALSTYATNYIREVTFKTGDYTQTASGNSVKYRDHVIGSGTQIHSIAPLSEADRYAYAGWHYSGAYYGFAGHFLLVDADSGTANTYQSSGSTTTISYCSATSAYSVAGISSDAYYASNVYDSSSNFYVRKITYTNATNGTTSSVPPWGGAYQLRGWISGGGAYPISRWLYGTKNSLITVAGLVMASNLGTGKTAVFDRMPIAIANTKELMPEARAFCTDQFYAAATVCQSGSAGGTITVVDADLSTLIVDLTDIDVVGNIPTSHNNSISFSATIIPHQIKGYRYKYLTSEANVLWPGAIPTTYDLIFTGNSGADDFIYKKNVDLAVGEVQTLDVKPFAVAPGEKIKIIPHDTRQIWAHVTKIERT